MSIVLDFPQRPAITGTRPRVLGCCVACLLAQTHDTHDTTLPVVQRASITAPVAPAPTGFDPQHPLQVPDPDLPGYLA